MVLAVMLLALVNWILSPDEALRWLRGMLILPVLWLALMLWRRSMLEGSRRRGVDDRRGIVRYFGSTVTLVILSVGLCQITAYALRLWVRIGDPGTDPDLERRILGLAASAVFVIIGNGLPKILTPLSVLPREKAELVTAARRFVGTTMLLLGLVAAFAFLSAPIALATAVMQWVAGAGLLTVLGAIVWMNVSASRREG